MTNEEIKLETEKQYAAIKKAELRLVELRTLCNHETTFDGIWSYRPGSYEPAIICSDCGKLIKLKYDNIITDRGANANKCSESVSLDKKLNIKNPGN